MKNLYENLDNSLKRKLAEVKFVVFDFDGVFTDNSIWHSADGTEVVKRSRYDSQGFDLLEDAGLIDRKTNKETELKLLILSRETSLVVASVAKKLHLTCTQSTYKKPEALQEEMNRYGYKKEQVLYMGNDLNDLHCFDLVGLSVATADADSRVIVKADYVTIHSGGQGAIRELCELFLYARNIHPDIKG